MLSAALIPSGRVQEQRSYPGLQTQSWGHFPLTFVISFSFVLHSSILCWSCRGFKRSRDIIPAFSEFMTQIGKWQVLHNEISRKLSVKLYEMRYKYSNVQILLIGKIRCYKFYPNPEKHVCGYPRTLVAHWQRIHLPLQEIQKTRV